MVSPPHLANKRCHFLQHWLRLRDSLWDSFLCCMQGHWSLWMESYTKHLCVQNRARIGGSLWGFISPCMYHDWTVREAPLDLAKEYKNEWCRHPIWRIRGVTSYSIGSGYVTAFGIPFFVACKAIGVDGWSLRQNIYVCRIGPG